MQLTSNFAFSTAIFFLKSMFIAGLPRFFFGGSDTSLPIVLDLSNSLNERFLPDIVLDFAFGIEITVLDGKLVGS